MQILENGIEVPTNSDDYNLTDDLANMGETSNVTYLVSSQSARNLLTTYDGLTVRRLDLAGRPTEVWDGATWTRSPVVTAGVIVPDGFWAITGGPIKTVTTGLTQVTATLQMVRTGPNMTINVADTTLTSAIIPAGFRPSANAIFAATVNNQFGEYSSSPQLIVNTGGAVIGRSTSGGGVPLNTGYTLFISVSWYI